MIADSPELREAITNFRLKEICHSVILGKHSPSLDGAKMPYFYSGGQFKTLSACPIGEIDLHYFSRGIELPSIQLGVYSLNGDALTTCFAASNAPRPAALNPQSNVSLCCLRRSSLC